MQEETVPNIEMRERWLDAIVERQYELYSRRDAKLQSIATLDAFFLGVLALAFQDLSIKPVASVALVGCVLMIFVSIVISLWHIRPNISSGRSADADANLRSLTGIQSFPDWRSYFEAVASVTPEKYLESAARQAYGMSSNNIRSYRLVGYAVYATIAAAILLAAAAIAQWMPATPTPTG